MTGEEAKKEIIDMANALQLIPNTPKGKAVSMALEALEEQEPKIGYWISGHEETGALGITYTEKICSNCGWSHSLVIPNNYCPKCGVRMEMEGEKV